MGVYWKPIFKTIDQIADKSLDAIETQIIELEQKRIARMEEINREAAFGRAKNLGLSPVDHLDAIRTQLNEKIISTMKDSDLTHQELADIALIPRTRVTAIMNHHLERVSIDCMIKILNILGINTEIHLF